MDRTTLAIIPCYKEAPEVVRASVIAWAAKCSVVVVIDGEQEALRLPELELDQVTLLRQETNQGQGAAIRRGLAYFLAQDLNYCFTVDADGQHPATNYDQLIEPLRSDKVDIVFGSRFMTSTSASRIPSLRRAVLRVARSFNNFVTGLRMSDAHNGLRAMNQAAAQCLLQGKEARMAHATEFPLLIAQSSLRWREVPVQVRYTAYSQRKPSPLLRIPALAVQLLRLKFKYERR